MREFINSPAFLWWAIGLVFLVIILAVLTRNLHWIARGITPPVMVAALRRPGDWLKKAIPWVAFLAVVGVALWWLTSGGSLTWPSAPSAGGVLAFMGHNWVWFLVPGAAVWALRATDPVVRIMSAKVADQAGQAAGMLAITALILGLVYNWAPEWFGAPSSPASRPIAASPIPLESRPVATWAKLVLPPGGTGPRIPVPVRMHIAVIGNDYRVHCVYSDGHEVAGVGTNMCPSGDMPFIYITNERTGEANIVSYSFGS